MSNNITNANDFQVNFLKAVVERFGQSLVNWSIPFSIRMLNNKNKSGKCISGDKFKVYFYTDKRQFYNGDSAERNTMLCCRLVFLDENGDEDIRFYSEDEVCNNMEKDPTLYVNLNKANEEQIKVLKILGDIFGFVKINDRSTMLFTKMMYSEINSTIH